MGNVLEVAAGLDPHDLVILVSANRKDFCDKDGVLAPALVADLGSLPKAASVQVVPSLADAFPLFEADAAEARGMRDAMRELEGDDYEGAIDPEDVISGPVLEACGGLTGQLLSEADGDRVQLETLTGRIVTLQLALPAHLWDASVYEVEPIPETLAWSEYDRYGDRSLGHAIVQCYLTIDGTIPVSEADAVSNEWHVEHLDDSYEDEDLDNDGFGEDRAWLAISFTVEMRFSATVVVAAYSVEALELEAVGTAVR